ncbi:MAG: hypothetical protein PVSMB9_07450 [Candidatus Dormibacteria bacterium]
MKGAIIDGGGSAHFALRQPGQPLAGLEPILLEELVSTDLEQYDAVIVPRSCDGDVLLARRHQFARFLDRGGILVAFGELWTDWLPGARWEPEAPQDTQPPAMVARHQLLEELSPDDLWWHREPGGWCCHGHVRPPAGAEVLVATADGGSWWYVDRTTTRGVIVSASNLDLDTHAHHGNAVARTLLERLMLWIRQEVERGEGRRHLPSDRIAGYFSGVHFQHGFFAPRSSDFAIVPAAELAAVDLAAHRAIWILRESDQRSLQANAPKLASYLEEGGRIIAFEEIDRPWLPGVRWLDRQVEISSVRRTNHPIAAALGDFTHPWHAHGALEVGQGAEVLVSTDDGAALLATYRVGKGQVLAGTIDADSHAGYGSSIPAPFLNAVLEWSRAALPELALR